MNDRTVSFGINKEGIKQDETRRHTEEEKIEDAQINIEEEQWVLQAETERGKLNNQESQL